MLPTPFGAHGVVLLGITGKRVSKRNKPAHDADVQDMKRKVVLDSNTAKIVK